MGPHDGFPDMHTRLNERGMSTVDIEKVLRSDDVDAIGKVIYDHGLRRYWKNVLRGLQGDGSPTALYTRGLAEAALATLDQQGPAATAIQVLCAEERLVELNQARRWVTFMEAREEGATWEEIAAAVDGTGAHLRSWYANRIAALDPPFSDEDMARARAVLDDTPADTSADGPVSGEPGPELVVDDPPVHGER